MKKKSPNNPAKPVPAIDEDTVRDYAYHLYEQSGCIPGHELDNWLEARACLQANIPAHQSRARLFHHVNGRALAETT